MPSCAADNSSGMRPVISLRGPTVGGSARLATTARVRAGLREWPAFVAWFSENLQPSLESWIGPVEVVYEGRTPLSPDGRYVFGYQPHGLFPIGARQACGAPTVGRRPVQHTMESPCTRVSGACLDAAGDACVCVCEDTGLLQRRCGASPCMSVRSCLHARRGRATARAAAGDTRGAGAQARRTCRCCRASARRSRACGRRRSSPACASTRLSSATWSPGAACGRCGRAPPPGCRGALCRRRRGARDVRASG